MVGQGVFCIRCIEGWVVPRAGFKFLFPAWSRTVISLSVASFFTCAVCGPQYHSRYTHNAVGAHKNTCQKTGDILRINACFKHVFCFHVTCLSIILLDCALFIYLFICISYKN